MILIAGAGIGGLTLAIALQRRGADVEILEQVPEMSHVGAGRLARYFGTSAVWVLLRGRSEALREARAAAG